MQRIGLILLVTTAGLAFSQSSVTYTNGPGICRYSAAQASDCLSMAYTDENGNPGSLWITWSTGTTNWVQWGDSASPEPLCTNLSITSSPVFPTVSYSSPGPFYSTFEGTCSGVDSNGRGYTLAYKETMEEYYRKGTGGKGGGGAGVRRVIVGGSFTITR